MGDEGRSWESPTEAAQSSPFFARARWRGTAPAPPQHHSTAPRPQPTAAHDSPRQKSTAAALAHALARSGAARPDNVPYPVSALPLLVPTAHAHSSLTHAHTRANNNAPAHRHRRDPPGASRRGACPPRQRCWLSAVAGLTCPAHSIPGTVYAVWRVLLCATTTTTTTTRCQSCVSPEHNSQPGACGPMKYLRGC